MGEGIGDSSNTLFTHYIEILVEKDFPSGPLQIFIHVMYAQLYAFFPGPSENDD
jgi:hypothetical protein